MSCLLILVHLITFRDKRFLLHVFYKIGYLIRKPVKLLMSWASGLTTQKIGGLKRIHGVSIVLIFHD